MSISAAVAVGYKEVSNFGRVRNAGSGVLGVGYANAAGFRSTGVNIAGVCIKVPVHRLVVTAFLTPPYAEKRNVRHKNGDSLDNRVHNLEWATRASAVRQRARRAKSRERPTVSAHSKPVMGGKLGTPRTEWVWYPSLRQAARELGIWNGSVSHCCLGKRKSTGGSQFAFAKADGELPCEEWRWVEVRRVAKGHLVLAPVSLPPSREG